MNRRQSLLSLMTLATSGLSSCALHRSGQSGDVTSAAPAPDPSLPPAAPAPSVSSIPLKINGPVRPSYSSCKTPGKFVALTFDDGPDPEDTPRLLSHLRARNVKATFFVIGRNVNAYPRVLEQTLAEGHEIANHSMTHPVLSKLSDAGLAREIGGCDEAITRVLGGYKAQCLRPPYGALTARQKEWVMREYGHPSIMWSVDPLDWKIRNSAHVSRALIGGAGPGGILLAHDIHPTTVAAVPSVLDALLARGFQFVTIGQLINLENGARPPASTLLRFTAGSL